MLPSRAPSSQAAATSRSVSVCGARIVPRRIAVCASERQARAAARVGKVLRIRVASRAFQTLAW